MSFPNNLWVLVGFMRLLRTPELTLLPIFALISLKQHFLVRFLNQKCCKRFLNQKGHHRNSMVAHENLT